MFGFLNCPSSSLYFWGLALKECGSSNVSQFTSKIASIKLQNRNANRDFFRYVCTPVDPVFVECPVLKDPGGEEVITRRLPMLDPHELLDYLWRKDHIKVPPEKIKPLALVNTCLFFTKCRG